MEPLAPTDLFNVALKVVDHVDVMLGYWDRDLRCRFANAAYETWFGRPRDKILGMEMKDLLGPLFELNLPYIQGVLQGKAQVFEREIPLPNGTVRQSLACYYPDIADGEVVGFSVQVADVSRLKELERQLVLAKLEAEKLATHDFLTGLPNRVLLATSVASAVARARRNGGFCGVALIDFDSFKEVNDTLGHDAGDAFLKEVARRMQCALRSTDTVIRLGGDEFILLTCDVETLEGLQHAVGRVIEAICQPLDCSRVTLSPSLSCGIAAYPLHGDNSDALLQAADAAMYKAKSQGKGRVVFAY